MNREIKFRAWDDGVMIYSDKNASDELYERLRYFFHRIREDAILMQYTGLKDKNGKEIYEGDLLKTDDVNLDLVYGDISDVQFHNGSFYIIIRHDFLALQLFDLPKIYKPSDYPNIEKASWLEGFEVVGSIHENPELLNGA